MRALFIEHDHVSLGGPIWRAFQARGYEIERFLIIPEELFKTPNVRVTFPDFSDFDIIVPMGAPYGVYEEGRVGNWLLPELELLRQAHNAGQPIFGICFGGQMMAKVLGGSVAKAPKAELGWYEIQSSDTTLISNGPWFEYHWDRWTTPPGATEIARTELAVQAFTMGRTLALQFHPEVDLEVLDEWLAMEGGCAEVESEGVYVEQLRAQTKSLQSKIDKNAYDLVNAFLDRIATAEVAPVN